MEEADLESIDVSRVKGMDIPAGEFPAQYPRSDFRVWIAAKTHNDIIQHASEDTGIELCGVLVGELRKDDFGPFAVIQETIRGESADSKGTQVTFTQETWEHVYGVLDSEFPGQQILGWYHTHPGFGVFLSSMDVFIQENFFSLPCQVAYVVDPVGADEGIFVWRDGRPSRASLFWVGDRVAALGPEPTCGSDRDQSPAPAGDEDVPSATAQPPLGGKAREDRERMWWHAAQLALLAIALMVIVFDSLVETASYRLGEVLYDAVQEILSTLRDLGR